MAEGLAAHRRCSAVTHDAASGTAVGLGGLLTPAILKARFTGPHFAHRAKARGRTAWH